MKNKANIENIIDEMRSLKLDGRLFEILKTECGLTIVPSLFGLQNIDSFNNDGILLRSRLMNLYSNITIHAL